MKRALAATATGLFLLTPAAGIAGGDRDFAVGAGSNEFALGALGEASFTISAHSGPGGENPRGYVTSKGDPDGPGPVPPFTAEGEVTCLRVVGNRASVKWRIEKGTGSAAQFQGGGDQSFLEDNGPPRGGKTADRAAIDPPLPAAVFRPAETRCDPPYRPTLERLNKGNLTVHDAIER